MNDVERQELTKRVVRVSMFSGLMLTGSAFVMAIAAFCAGLYGLVTQDFHIALRGVLLGVICSLTSALLFRRAAPTIAFFISCFLPPDHEDKK